MSGNYREDRRAGLRALDDAAFLERCISAIENAHRYGGRRGDSYADDWQDYSQDCWYVACERDAEGSIFLAARERLKQKRFTNGLTA
jgi:hypothetical protein